MKAPGRGGIKIVEKWVRELEPEQKFNFFRSELLIKVSHKIELEIAYSAYLLHYRGDVQYCFPLVLAITILSLPYGRQCSDSEA